VGSDAKSILDGYRPFTDSEAADVARIREIAGDPWLRDTPLHLTASAVIVHPSTRRVLLRWHERQQAWLQVGGHGDPGESDPLAIALRDTVEALENQINSWTWPFSADEMHEVGADIRSWADREGVPLDEQVPATEMITWQAFQRPE
jgi:hypothetical protein